MTCMNKKISFISSLAVALCLFTSTTFGLVPQSLMKTYQARMRSPMMMPNTVLHLYEDDHLLDSAEAAKPLTLTMDDLQRLSEMKSRSITIPILIMDAVVPGQRLSFQSGDPRFHKLMKYVMDENSPNEIGIIGFNPLTGRPLSIGVTLDIQKDQVLYVETDDSPFRKREVAISVRGKRRFEVVGEPWLDDTGSFYMASVDILDQRQEELPSDLHRHAKHLSSSIPSLVQEWADWVLKSKKTTPAGLKELLSDIGPMPSTKSLRELAIWVSALVNPSPALAGVCLEIRPAMLSCRNDHDRLVLASTALQSSIDHLSGKRRLF